MSQKHQPSHGRHAQRNSPPNASQIERVASKGTLSSSVGAFQDHNYYHIQYPSQQSQITKIPTSMQSTGSVETHSHLQFLSKGLQQSVISPLETKSSLVSADGNPLSLHNKTITNKQTELLHVEDGEKPRESVISDPSEILLKGSPINPNLSLVNEPTIQQQLRGQLKDKDYSYVKFMRR